MTKKSKPAEPEADARGLLYTQMSRGYVREAEVVKLLVKGGAGATREITPIVVGELAALRKLPIGAFLAGAVEHGIDPEDLRQAVVGAMMRKVGAA